MNKLRPLLAAALIGGALTLAGPVQAHGGDHGPRWGEHRHHDKHHHRHHHHRHGRDAVYYGAPVVIQQPPPVIMPRTVYYEPAYYYPPRRDPSLVIGVDIPPLVIPLR